MADGVGRVWLWVAIAMVAGLAGCEPADQRPGVWLSGDLQADFPQDWSFSNDYREIYLEVDTPYFLPHSVTIWCSEVDGALFIGARDPESKNWPGWVDDAPDAKLKVGEKVYAVRLEPLEDVMQIDRVTAAYQRKYELPSGRDGAMRYWSVGPGSG